MYLRGEYGDNFTVQFRIVNGHCSVSAQSESQVELTGGVEWTSYYEPSYYIVGSFNDWKCGLMLPEDRANGLWRYHFTMPSDGKAEFQLVTDGGDSGVTDGETMPDEGLLSDTYIATGPSGTSWQIFVDHNVDDPNKMLYFRRSTAREEHLVNV